MKVRFTGARTGLESIQTAWGLAQQGDVLEVPDAEGAQLIVKHQTDRQIKTDASVRREELDARAVELGIDPAAFGTKADLADEITRRDWPRFEQAADFEEADDDEEAINSAETGGRHPQEIEGTAEYERARLRRERQAQGVTGTVPVQPEQPAPTTTETPPPPEQPPAGDTGSEGGNA